MASIIPNEKLSLDERTKKLDALSDKINTKYGKTIIGRVGRHPEIKDKLEVKFLPTASIEINEATGGGFPIGKTTILAGNNDSGKTHLLLQTIGERQKQDPDFIALWCESEQSLTLNQLKLFDIDESRFYVIYPSENGAEETLDKIEAYLKANVGIDIVVINSLKMLCPKEELDKLFSAATIGLQARLNAKMQRKFTSLIADNNAAFVLVCHLTTEIGSYSKDPLKISGGLAIKFGSMLTLDFRKKSIAEADPVPRDGYMKIGFTVRKNHCVSDRNIIYVKGDYFVRINEGIEKILPIIDRAVSLGIIQRSGAFYKDIDIETGNPKVVNDVEYKWQGKPNFRTFLLNNPDYFEELKLKVADKLFSSVSEEEYEDIARLSKQEEMLLEDMSNNMTPDICA